MSKATGNQIEFLKNLGFKGGAKLTFEQATAKIDELLEREKQTGCPLTCPGCGAAIAKRPKVSVLCKGCGVKLRHVCGRLYTPDQLDAREEQRQAEFDQQEQKQFLRDGLKNTKDDIRDDLKSNREMQRQDCGPIVVGYRIVIGEACFAAMDRNGAFVPLELAAERPDLLPPYKDSCRYDTCDCRTEYIAPGDPPGSKMLNADGSFSPIPRQLSKPSSPSSGCVVVLLALVIVAALAAGI
jgi:hypothetical protein